jgi:hypothetical protein
MEDQERRVTIEQLWYTRPAASLAHDPGFQIVASSPGFADPQSALTNKAITLCRYDTPPRHFQGPAPVSYGWADAAGVRYCFRRAAAGTDEFGRRGNLTAHILAGPPELLPGAGIAARLCSPWWWAGAVPATRTLPVLDGLDAITAAPPPPLADQDLLAAFLDALLTRPSHGLLALHAKPADIAALVLAVEEAVPRLMDAHSLSTYESRQTASLFNVVGTVEINPSARTVRSQPDARTPPDVASARTILLAGDRPRVTRTAAQAAGIGTGLPHVPALAGLVNAYAGLDSGAAPSPPFLLTILASADTLDLTLAEFPRVAQDLAAEIIRDRGDVFAALSGLAARGLTPDTATAIGTAAGRELASARTAATRWDIVLERLADLDKRAHDACRRLLLLHIAGTPRAAAGMAGALILGLLRQAEADGLPIAHPAVHNLLAALGTDWALAVAAPGVPASWRARVLGIAVKSAARPQPAKLARYLLDDPALIGPLAAELADLAPLRAAVDALAAAEQSTAAAVLATALPPADGDALAVWFGSGRTSPDARLEFLAQCARHGLATPPGARWPAMASSALADWLAAELASARVPRPSRDVVDLLRSAGDLSSHAWLSVLGLAEPGQRPQVTTLTAALRQVSPLPPQQATVAIRCAAVFFVLGRPTAEQLGHALPVLDRQPERGLTALADACLLVHAAERDIEPVLTLGRCVLDLVARDRPARNSDLGLMYARLLRRLVRAAPRCRDSLAYDAAKYGDAARYWWRQAAGGRGKLR